MNGDSRIDSGNFKDSQKSNSSSHLSGTSSDSHGEPVAPQRRAKRETVYVMDAGRPPGRSSNHSSRSSSHSGFSISPRAESMYLDNASADRVMVVQPSYVQRQSYHSMMSSNVQGHSSLTTSSQKSYSSSSSSTNTQQSSSRSQHSVTSASTTQQSRNVAPPRNRGKPLVVYNPSWNGLLPLIFVLLVLVF